MIASPFPEPEPISTDPSKGAKVRLGRPDLPRAGRGLGHPRSSSSSRRSGCSCCGVPSPRWPATRRTSSPTAATGSPPTRRRCSFGILDLLQVTVFVSVFALVLAMPVALGIAIFLTQYSPRRLSGSAGLHGGSAGRGAVDRLRRVGPVRARAGAQAVRDVAEQEPRTGCSCSRPATRRWPAAAPSSPRASCWR